MILNIFFNMCSMCNYINI